MSYIITCKNIINPQYYYNSLSYVIYNYIVYFVICYAII